MQRWKMLELPNTVNFISVPVDSKYFDGVPTDEVEPIVEKKKAGAPKNNKKFLLFLGYLWWIS